MSIYVEHLSGTELKFKSGVYPGGECWVRFSPGTFADQPVSISLVRILARLWSSQDVMELFIATDALRRVGVENIDLVMPYLPYARQDRVANFGESHSLRVFADLINAQCYQRVVVWDVHSDVAMAVLNCAVNIPMDTFVGPTIQAYQKNVVLVAPDAGSIKKVEALAKQYDVKYVRADKARDTLTGELSGAVVYTEHIGNTPFLIVDDICDGGRTFLNLEPELRKFTHGGVCLYVTHGIFSNGTETLEETFDWVIVANMRNRHCHPENFIINKGTDHEIIRAAFG